MPLSMRGVLTRGTAGAFSDRQAYWVYLFARLKPGLSIDRAQLRLETIYRPIINEVEAPLQHGMSPATLAQFRKNRLNVTPGRLGQSTAQQNAGTPITLLFVISGLYLLSPARILPTAGMLNDCRAEIVGGQTLVAANNRSKP
ncbi:MAG: hypothetical protein ABI877_05245 [Gemmatimonadaceae bacterium]